jgi:hypothetical protein
MAEDDDKFKDRELIGMCYNLYVIWSVIILTSISLWPSGHFLHTIMCFSIGFLLFVVCMVHLSRILLNNVFPGALIVVVLRKCSSAVFICTFLRGIMLDSCTKNQLFLPRACIHT